MTRTSKTSTTSAATAGSLAALLAASMLAAPAPAEAQERHVVEPGELDRAAAEHRTEDQARRDEVLDALERERVREAADRMDVDLTEAREAARTLDGTALEQVAAKARDVNEALSGGQATITLSTTALVIALLILLLLVVD